MDKITMTLNLNIAIGEILLVIGCLLIIHLMINIFKEIKKQ